VPKTKLGRMTWVHRLDFVVAAMSGDSCLFRPNSFIVREVSILAVGNLSVDLKCLKQYSNLSQGQ
jgi:hypothetical protein